MTSFSGSLGLRHWKKFQTPKSCENVNLYDVFWGSGFPTFLEKNVQKSPPETASATGIGFRCVLLAPGTAKATLGAQIITPNHRSVVRNHTLAETEKIVKKRRPGAPRGVISGAFRRPRGSRSDGKCSKMSIDILAQQKGLAGTLDEPGQGVPEVP